jgi:type II secretory pathway pseudopilin PulG
MQCKNRFTGVQTMKPITSRKTEAGFTLLELLLVVGVGALLLIGGIVTYRIVSEGNKAAETTRLIMTVRNEAQNLAQGQGYEDVQAALVAAKIIKDNQKNAFGGDFTVTGAADTLTVALTQIPPTACRKLAMGIKDQGVKLNGAEPPKTLGDAPCAGEDSLNDLSWEFP